ncbi:MAG: ribosome assembly cofactor RimP [Bacteroidales bacterium]|nr:ribosome assembly cofactor RimP [Candidatus Colicola faecequi]
MIDKNLVQQIALDYLREKDYELITCTVSADNRILVEIDSMDGVDVDFCVELSHYIQDHLDREVEDFELEVGSVSITDPFKTLMQYEKNLGNDVEVLTKDGRKLHGVLAGADEEAFELEAEVLVQVEGKKKKQKELQTLRFGYDEVKYCKYDLKV